MESWYRRQFWLGAAGAKVANLAIAGIAHFFFVLWYRRRQDAIYGLFALCCMSWIALVIPYFAVPSAETVLAVQRSMALAAAWFSATYLVFGVRLLGWTSRRIELIVWSSAAGLSGVAILLPASRLPWLPPMMALTSLSAVFAVLCCASCGLRRKPVGGAPALLLSATAILAGLLCDCALATGLRAWPTPRVASYGVLTHALVVGGFLVNQFIRDREAHERMKVELDDKARASEEALSARYAAAAALDRRFAAAAERERLLAEVHEGLGAHLRQSRELAQAGSLTPAAAESLLNAAMNELRIAIDSSRPGANDLLMMLGNLRYRLESRLRRAGIALEWEICDQLPPDRLSAAMTADISRIAYEAFSNTIRHSGASRLRLRVVMQADHRIAIEIVDDGHGFEVMGSALGRGLRNMHRLAARMGASLHIDSGAGGTRLELGL